MGLPDRAMSTGAGPFSTLRVLRNADLLVPDQGGREPRLGGFFFFEISTLATASLTVAGNNASKLATTALWENHREPACLVIEGGATNS